MFVITYLSTTAINESMDYTILSSSLIGVWFMFFALGALLLLCGTIFLESNKALSAAGVLMLGQYILERIGGLVESLNFTKFILISLPECWNNGWSRKATFG